jgi:site-specific DNA recombinase
MNKTLIRCAIYTRKSTDEGLDQDFNSLDAQREAAEAFIKSQKHQGWTLVRTQYDDGGFSGASLDRPALQNLLRDVEAGRVDCIVVYKVDRLSRSLLDFARLIDRFDQKSVSFVSVTQQFNTTTSLGRLTLNILLSFAQFEREIIGERTRDKMSAARRKGKWMGGTPVLGYDVDPGRGRLIVNQEEAKRVREIFRLFCEHGSLKSVVAALGRRKWRNKTWISQSGIQHEGHSFTRTSLARLLGNAVYAGKVEYRSDTYPGAHEPIISPDIWERTRPLLSEGKRKHTVHQSQKALLAGLLYCKSCNLTMVPTYTSKQGRRYRYYVCRNARRNGWQSCPTKAVSADLIEQSVTEQVTRCMTDPDSDTQDLVRRVVRHVSYDGVTGRVALTIEDENAA